MVNIALPQTLGDKLALEIHHMVLEDLLLHLLGGAAPILPVGWRDDGIVSIISAIAAVNVIAITNGHMVDGNTTCSRRSPSPGSGVMFHF